MSEVIVNFATKEKLSTPDLNAIGTLTRASIDHVVADGIGGGARGFSGFTVTAVGSIATVGQGRLYNADGSVWGSYPDAGTPIDFVTKLPATAKKIVIVVGYTPTTSTPTNEEAREVLFDTGTRQAQANPVATRDSRLANVGALYGDENPTPVAPVIDPQYVAIAQIVLNTTGVESVTMLTDNMVKSARAAFLLATSAKATADAFGPKLTTLDGDIARIANSVASKTDQDYTTRIALDVAKLKYKANIPQAANDYGSDYFLDTSYSDPAYAGYSAAVQEGIHFPSAADNYISATSRYPELALVNPLDAGVSISPAGLLLPAHKNILWRQQGGNAGSLALNQFSFTSDTLVKAAMSPGRVQFGPEFIVSASSSWWGSGKYTDVATGTYTLNGATYQVLPNGQTDAAGNQLYRVAQRWYSFYTDDYWTRTASGPVPYGGYPWCQTFLCSQDMWVKGIGVGFSRLDVTGDVTMGLCELNADGTPNMGKVLAITTVPYANLWLDGRDANPITRYPIEPTLLRSGKRYGTFVITGGNHYIIVADASSYLDGTLFYRNGSPYWFADPAHQFLVNFDIAQFNSSRTEIQFQPLTVGGGISSVDIQAQMVIPDSCLVDYQVQIAGLWHSLKDEAQPLASLPGTVPLRMVFQGTTSIQPSLVIPGSAVKASRMATAFKHVSTLRTLAAASGHLTLEATLEAYGTGDTASLKVNVGGVEYAPTSVVSTVNPNGSTDMKAAFALPNGTTQFRSVVNGATTTPFNGFAVSELDFVATP